MNMNVRPFATSCAAHMHANEYHVMEFPLVGYTREVEAGPIVKLGFIFISDDLSHDYEQVGPYKWSEFVTAQTSGHHCKLSLALQLVRICDCSDIWTPL